MAVIQYKWKTPYTAGGNNGDKSGGTINEGGQEWRALASAGYYFNIIDHVFTGDFEAIIACQMDYMGAGIAYRNSGTAYTSHHTGFSSDANGPYGGSEQVWGMSDGEQENYNYHTQYHAFNGSGSTQHQFVWHYKATRMYNTLLNQYSTQGAHGPWTNFSSAASTTSGVGDDTQCIVGVGTAGGTGGGRSGQTGYIPSTIIYVRDFTKS